MLRDFFLPRALAAYGDSWVYLNTGINANFAQLMTRIVWFLAVSSVAVCTTLFLIGAFMMVLYAGKPDKAAQGKDIMINSVIGLAVILGSYAILRTLLAILE